MSPAAGLVGRRFALRAGRAKAMCGPAVGGAGRPARADRGLARIKGSSQMTV